MPLPMPTPPPPQPPQQQSQPQVMMLSEDVLTRVINSINAGVTASRQFAYLATIHYLTGAIWDSNLQGLLISEDVLTLGRNRPPDANRPPMRMWCLREDGGVKLKAHMAMLKRVQEHLQPQPPQHSQQSQVQ